MQKKNSGFSLIELMVVIAIIGILASIAVPSYREYVIKAHAAEAMILSRGIANKVIDFHLSNGHWPDLADITKRYPEISTSYNSDIIHSVHIGRDQNGPNTGQVWLRLHPRPFGMSNGHKHLRASLSVKNDLVVIDWCDSNGNWPTTAQLMTYFGC